ncbi:uncharacterized protein SPSK_08042 [Sporothrix schenckii 1099-18]|uniref:Uncharacterized protein n=2 Tax=Sporothrix schenckii TaxID=29908 RepID=U7Q3H0_SPOS1|nr:uncharacterized protein SPSK_08042 [Sporothrix schenckii 1099-18]ERT01565.1 hypothetical protein HMPREF1624_02816 [Sporothrix schenckii ATCC 58251]KJR88782.1 hypothetical protein SPSK_08042 [Sporothrix schenckii 1099-18]
MSDTQSSPQSLASANKNDKNNQDQKQQTWSGAAYGKYNELYESWAPWAEDVYLRYFTRHNKASYATEDTLAKTKVTGIKQVDTLQDGVNGLVAGQLGQGGLAQPVGDWASKEGVNRAERNGKDDKGKYLPSGTPATISSGAEAVADGGKSAAGAVSGGVKSVGGAVGGLFGGGKKQ